MARFHLPNCIILPLQKSSLVCSWSTHQSVKHWKALMTTRAQEWPHVVNVTPSVTCFFRRVFWLAFLHLTRIYRIRVALSANWISNNGFLITQIFMFFFFCFVLFSSGKRRPLMMVRSSALWKWTGESTMERDRTWRLLKLQLPSLLLKDWKRNTLRCTRKSKSQSGLGGHQCCSKGAFLDLYCWNNAVEHCYSNRK